MRRKRRKLLIQAFKNSGFKTAFLSFLTFFLLSALVVWIFEPTITNYFDSMWYCFVSMTTIGFGDIAATTVVARIVTVVLWIYAVAITAIFTAVITGYFLDTAKMRADESIQEFLTDLEHLPELSKEKLEQLSQRVKKFNKK